MTMSARYLLLHRQILLLSAMVVLSGATPLSAQSKFTAWNLPSLPNGNLETKKDYGVCYEFEVIRPIRVSELGMFDDAGDGVQGTAVVRIQLYEASGKATRLLETMTFDAANPGELRGGFRLKPLAQPVTLLPGRYALTANGFDAANKAYDVARVANTPVVTRPALNDGGGAIRFLNSNRYYERDRLSRSKKEAMIGPPDRVAAGTFVFSPANLSPGPYAADYATLTTGVTSFLTVTDKTVNATYSYHYGSIAVLTDAAFPLLIEPGGSRLVLAAAATYKGDPNAARCVAFAHEQWGHAFGNGRARLFENAIKWASRKNNPTDIVVGLSHKLDATYYANRGYQVRVLDRLVDPSVCECDVLVIDFHGGYTEEFMAGVAEFTARGGGLVCTFMPWRYVHGGLRPRLGQVNALLEPFGVAYRSSLTQPTDFGFTNVAAVAYPIYFNAFPAAKLLYENRKGKIQLDSLAKAIALNTIAYAADGRPDLLASLTALYSTGTTNITDNAEPSSADMGQVVNVATLVGAQANRNLLGDWLVHGTALVAQGRRGGAEYEFSVSDADVYRIEIEGRQDSMIAVGDDFDLVLAVDGVSLGHHVLSASHKTKSVVGCWTPYLLAGQHTLRVFWDGVGDYNSLRLEAVRVQTATGADSNHNGIKDWVETWINSRCGLDETNSELVSYVTPFCLEGRDPYPPLMDIIVAGADAGSPPGIKPRPAPGGRWFADIPLAKSGDTTIQVSYQNGAKTETRLIRRAVVNVLDGGTFNIRKGDTLALTARPSSGWTSAGQMTFSIGDTQCTAKVQTSYQFNDTGTYTVTGTYTAPQNFSQSGSITVNVVGHSFSNNPACWVAKQRVWDVPSVGTDVTFESDSRLVCEGTAALPEGGVRFALLANQPEQHVIISRLGESGPILDSAHADGFNLHCGGQVYLKVMETYADGSQLIEMGMVMSPVVPTTRVRLRILTGGVVFEDGTILKELTATDWDELGSIKVRFVRAAGLKGSVCHEVKVYQDTVVLGTR
jgi:hypothetical protein